MKSRRKAREEFPGMTREKTGLLDVLAGSRTKTAGMLALLAASSALVPLVSPLAMAAGGFLAYRRWRHLHRLPLKLPIGMGLDPNERSPVDGQPQQAQGMFLLGHDTDERELWLSEADARQHVLMSGTTGSGKTEALLGFAANAMSWGSGLVYIDGKGDVSIYAKVFALAHQFGRVQDLMVLNFMTAGQKNDSVVKTSMRLNPFTSGSPDSLSQMIVSLMDDVGGDGAMWKGRATAMLTGIMRALCWLRDHERFHLNTSALRDHMNLKKIIALAEDERLSNEIRRSIRAYLSSLPGFSADRGNKQAQTTLDQHGYLEMQFTKIIGNMADVHGHILGTEGVDIDMNDVVLNRRILVVMLPALEKSPEEIFNLGKIILSSLKVMMGSALGSSLQGSWEDVVENRPTRSSSPFLCILDSVGYYLVEGSALMAGQSRSLGFSMIYSVQDIPEISKINHREGESIIANTSTKILMKCNGSWDGPPGTGRFSDLRKMTSGEAVILNGGRQAQGRMLYLASNVDKKTLKLRVTPLIAPVWDEAGESGAGYSGEQA